MDRTQVFETPNLAVHTAWQGHESRLQQCVLRNHPTSMWPDDLVGQTARPVRVLLVDDDSPVSRAIAQELVADQRLDLVGQATGLRDGRRKIKTVEFDVLLLGTDLGDGCGFDLIAEVKSHFPVAEVVVLSTHEDEERALQAFQLGATGYLLKSFWAGHFPRAVLQVANGGVAIAPQLARHLLHRTITRVHPPALGGHGAEQLSHREKEVLRMIAKGHTSVEIASVLRISAQTVNSHVRNMYRKLQVRSRAQAVSRASAQGIL